MSLRLSLGLRAKVTVLFGTGAALLSGSLAVVTYSLTRGNVLDEHEASAVRALTSDAAVLRQGLDQDDSDVLSVLQSLDTGPNRRPLIYRDGQWYGRSASDTGLVESMPAGLVTMADLGQAASQRVRINGRPALITTTTLPSANASLFEIDDLSEISSSLATLGRIVTGAAVATTVGGALVGWWGARGVLRPLQELARTAETIAAGDLTARLPDSHDRDLDPLAGSFNTMVAKLAARLDRDRRFAADVSHELRSPLQTLTAASAVLQSRSDTLDRRTAAAAALVAAEIQRFSALVEDLIRLATSDSPERSLVDLEPLLREALTDTSTSTQLLDIRSAPRAWWLDRRGIKQTLTNILLNAHHHAGGPVAVRVDVHDGHLRIVIDDNGPGIPPGERDLVFDRFARGRAASTRSDQRGVGLGLALVARHVEAHHGVVSISDRPSGGARITLLLPPRSRA